MNSNYKWVSNSDKYPEKLSSNYKWVSNSEKCPEKLEPNYKWVCKKTYMGKLEFVGIEEQQY